MLTKHLHEFGDLNCSLHIFAADTLTTEQSPQSCTCVFDYNLSRDTKCGMFYLFHALTQSLLYFTIYVFEISFQIFRLEMFNWQRVEAGF